ncbi:hypothetical protein ABT256_10945 [Amycolatopsis japonica]|uniref:hypothetical protein n=1 Tax=Amycolatopsis japonica TaxID=208439 RepID=UPI003319F0EC
MIFTVADNRAADPRVPDVCAKLLGRRIRCFPGPPCGLDTIDLVLTAENLAILRSQVVTDLFYPIGRHRPR